MILFSHFDRIYRYINTPFIRGRTCAVKADVNRPNTEGARDARIISGSNRQTSDIIRKRSRSNNSYNELLQCELDRFKSKVRNKNSENESFRIS